MRDSLYLAWRYLCFHRIKSVILIVSVAMIIFLPTGLKLIVEHGAKSLTSRADNTPLIVGAKGSPLELTINSLYFGADTPTTIPFSHATPINESRLATAIPLNTRFKAEGHPIVGTSIDYFDFRDLRITDGRMLATLGECVIGADVATKLQLAAGGSIVSSPESVFDLAGVYPLKMRIVGVLEKAGTPDDDAIFADLKTTWIIQGLAHGHMDMESPEAATGVLKRDGNQVVANASVKTYNEITPDNIHSFHFHGEPETFPVTAILAVPKDEKSATLLRGRYLDNESPVQIVQPGNVIADLLATVAAVEQFIIIGLATAGISALMTMALVFLLSLQLRAREIQTMHRIGGARTRVSGLIAIEIGFILTLGALLAGALVLLTIQFGPNIIEHFLL